jgi:malic enzyme
MKLAATFPYMFRGALDCRASCIHEEMKLAATFPYMFRGALDCRALCINEEMKLAATFPIANLAKEQSGMHHGSS